MQATLCENCQKIQPQQDPTGWFLVHKLGLVDPGENVHPLFGPMFGPPSDGRPIPGHTDHAELCGTECLIAYAQNGFQSTFLGLTEGEVPAMEPAPEADA